MSKLSLRPATLADVPVILSLIRALAEFEKLAHEVVATEEGLAKTLFGPKPYAEVLLADSQEGARNETVGFALYFHNYSTFLAKPGIYLEDLFVVPAARSRGVGEALLQAVAQKALERGCGRLEWAVLDWNQRAIDFYRRLSANPMSDWTTFRVAGDALARLAGGAQSRLSVSELR